MQKLKIKSQTLIILHRIDWYKWIENEITSVVCSYILSGQLQTEIIAPNRIPFTS